MQKTIRLIYVVGAVKNMVVHRAILVKTFPNFQVLEEVVKKPVNQKTIKTIDVFDKALVFYKVVDFCFGFEVGHEGLNF